MTKFEFGSCFRYESRLDRASLLGNSTHLKTSPLGIADYLAKEPFSNVNRFPLFLRENRYMKEGILTQARHINKTIISILEHLDYDGIKELRITCFNTLYFANVRYGDPLLTS